MRVLILGVTGMLGHAVYKTFKNNNLFDTWGTLRNKNDLNYFPTKMRQQLITNVDVLNHDEIINVFEKIKPNIVINCVGLIKQLSSAKDPLVVLPINSILPHRLDKLCTVANARLIQISTDCVFSGQKGGYTETDQSDAEDLYGKSKFIGELSPLSQSITLRTSIIGHELNSSLALVDWFIAQNDKVKGFIKCIYTGLPTVELANVIHDYVIPNKELSGLYQVAAKPINKLELLKIIAEIYKKEIEIEPDDKIIIDRSLSGKKFEIETGYVAPKWPILIEKMYESKKIFGV